MLADGLTKALQAGKFKRFREMMGLVDISSMIQIRREQEGSFEVGFKIAD